MSLKTERIGSNFTKEISLIIHEEIKDPNIRFVTLTGCDVTNDLSFAKVYFTTLDDKNREEVLESLNKASNYIEQSLAKKIEIRKMPQISFHYDNSIEYGKSIDKKIEEIHKND